MSEITWGDNGEPRPTTDKYLDGWDKIFGDKEPHQDTDSDIDLLDLEDNHARFHNVTIQEP